MSIEALPLHNFIGPAMANLFKETSSLVHALAKQALAKQAHALEGLNIEDKFFHTTWLHFIGDLHHVNTIMDFGKISSKAQKSPYLHKKGIKTHGSSS